MVPLNFPEFVRKLVNIGIFFCDLLGDVLFDCLDVAEVSVVGFPFRFEFINFHLHRLVVYL